MVRILCSNSLIATLLITLGTATASAIPTGPTLDVALTSWQLNLATGQETFTLAGPSVSLTGTGYDAFPPPSTPNAYTPEPGGAQNIPLSVMFYASNIGGGTFALGTVDGVVYTAVSPLGLYNVGPSFVVPPFTLPMGMNPVVTLPVTISGVSDTPAVLFGCTPDCLAPTVIPFQFNFLPATGSVDLQLSGPGGSASNSYTLQPFSVVASPTPEPASYLTLAVGLAIVGSGMKILRKVTLCCGKYEAKLIAPLRDVWRCVSVVPKPRC